MSTRGRRAGIAQRGVGAGDPANQRAAARGETAFRDPRRAEDARLRLAPRLPAHLTRMRAEGVGVGATRLSLAYERDGGSQRFTIEPTLATVPPNLVFEPAVAGSIRKVSVDGVVAELNLRREGARTVVPVQLSVDAPRVVEILVD